MADSHFNSPPNWPPPPAGWTPPQGWQPDPSWGPPPDGWQLWSEDRQEPPRGRALVVTVGVLVTLLVVMGAASSGVGGALVMLALPVLVTGLIAVLLGRQHWARIDSRRVGGLVMSGGLLLLVLGAVLAPPAPDDADETVTLASASGESYKAAADQKAADDAADKAAADKAAADQAAADQKAADDAADKAAADKAAADQKAADDAADKAAADKAAAAATWVVTDIVDGDTVDVLQGGTVERVRIIGIDTPERGECGFDEASDTLAAHILGERVILAAGARDDRDRYDRILRYVDRESDGLDSGLALIESGSAIARYDSRDGYGAHDREPAYVAADDVSDGPVVCAPAPAPAPAPVAPAPVPEPAPAPAPAVNSGPFDNCDAVRAAGRGPIRVGEPGFEAKFDRDGDGVGCE